jgi:hypothetical protein
MYLEFLWTAFPFSFQSSSQEVLINVCDQVIERSSKILAQRSKSVAAKLITTKELKDLGKLIDILAAETLVMTGKTSSGMSIKTLNSVF